MSNNIKAHLVAVGMLFLTVVISIMIMITPGKYIAIVILAGAVFFAYQIIKNEAKRVFDSR